MGFNNFEACLKFIQGGKSKYYGGGADVYDTKEEVIDGCFSMLAWCHIYNRGGKTYVKVVKILKEF